MMFLVYHIWNRPIQKGGSPGYEPLISRNPKPIITHSMPRLWHCRASMSVPMWSYGWWRSPTWNNFLHVIVKSSSVRVREPNCLLAFSHLSVFNVCAGTTCVSFQPTLHIAQKRCEPPTHHIHIQSISCVIIYFRTSGRAWPDLDMSIPWDRNLS